MAPGRITADDTAIPAAIVGSACWLVALIALSVSQGASPPTDEVWWWGVAAIGTLSGIVGLTFLLWRRRRMASRDRSTQ